MASYNVRSGVIDTEDRNSGAAGAAKAVGRGAVENALGAGSFGRGRLYLTEDGVVFARSPTESRVGNFVDGLLAKGPINPVRLLGIYNPYEAPLDRATEVDGSWVLPYSEIDGLSLLSKSSGNELFIRPRSDPSVLYRIRNDHGTDYVGFYRGNRKTAKKFAGNIYALAEQSGGIEEFDAGPEFSVRTKQRAIPKDRSVTRADLVESPPRLFDGAVSSHGSSARSESAAGRRVAEAASGSSGRSGGATADTLGGGAERRPTLRVRNATERRQQIKLGCRTSSEILFNDQATLGTGEATEWTQLPDEEFEIGIMAGADVQASQSFEPSALDGPLTVTLSSSGFVFDDGSRTETRDVGGESRTATTATDGEPTSTDHRRGGADAEDAATADPSESDSGSLRGVKTLLAGCLLMFLGGPAVVVLFRPPAIVQSALWTLAAGVIVVGLYRILRSWRRR
jgi:hypothetical protein